MIALLFVVLVALADRTTKAVTLAFPMATQQLIGSVLTFESSVNIGGPLGFPIPLSVSLGLGVLLTVMLFMVAVLEERELDQVLLVGVMVGLLSNTYDRFQFGYVLDTLRLTPGLAFNIADLLIVTGAVVVGVRLVRREERAA